MEGGRKKMEAASPDSGYRLLTARRGVKVRDEPFRNSGLPRETRGDSRHFQQGDRFRPPTEANRTSAFLELHPPVRGPRIFRVRVHRRSVFPEADGIQRTASDAEVNEVLAH